MAYREDTLVKNGRVNRNFYGKRKEQNLPEFSNSSVNYLTNNLIEYDYLGTNNPSVYNNQNNYSNVLNGFDYPFSDADNFENNFYQNNFNNLSETSEETDNEELKNESEVSKDALLKLERKKRKFLENKLICLQASMKQKQFLKIQDKKEKLYKKMTTRNLMRSHSNTNSMQLKNNNRRFEGDGNDNEDLNCQVKNKNLLNEDNLGELINNSNFKIAKELELRRLLNQQKKLNNYSTDLNKNFIGNQLNGSSLNDDLFKIDNKNLNLESTRNVKKNIKDNILNNDKQFKHNFFDNNLNDSKFFNIDHNIKNKIVNSMKYNFDSMLDYIQNQSFSQDGFMAIQQFINIIMMQNCQFMNHQQILLCWLQKLQLHFSTNSSNLSSSNNKNFSSFDQKNLIQNPVSYPGTENRDSLLNFCNQFNNSLTLNNQVDLNSKTNNYYDNLKSNLHQNAYLNIKNNTSSNQKNYPNFTNNNLLHADSSNLVFYKDQQSSFSSDQTSNNTNSLSNISPKLKKLSNNLKANKHTDKTNKLSSKSPSELKEIYEIIEKLIEDKKDSSKNFLSKLKSFKDFYDFEDQGQAVGEEDSSKVDLNSHSDNSIHGILNKKTNNPSIINTLKIATNGNLSSSSSNSNKSPQLGLYISPSTGAIRKKVRNNTDNVETITSKSMEQIQPLHLSLSDEKNKSESVRPLMAAEGRSSESQSKVLTVNNNSKITSVISSTINSNNTSSVVTATSTTSNGRVLLKRHPLTGSTKYNRDIDSDISSENDSPLSSINQIEPISENENLNSAIINSNQVNFVENSDRDNLEQKDEKRNFVNLGRNDTEVRLSGDGEQGF